MIAAVFSMMFTIMNCLLIALTFETNLLRFSLCGFIVTFELAALIFSNFNFNYMSYTAWATIVISIIFFSILLPFYGYVIITIINEQLEETMQTVTQKDFFQKMFDSMQEGICTIDQGRIIFMNDLCNKFTSELSGLRDFENNINENEEKD